MCDLLWSDPDDRLCKFLKYLLSVRCCGSRVFIPDPDSFPTTRIPDPDPKKKKKFFSRYPTEFFLTELIKSLELFNPKNGY
jgi:hypothetical protein